MSHARPPLLQRIARSARHLGTSPGTHLRLVGALCGLYLLVWCHGFVARWGTSLPPVAGLAAGLALGLELAWWRWSRSELRPARIRTWTSFALHLGLAGWTVALPGLSAGWSALVAKIPVETLAAPAVTWGVLIGGGIALLSIPAFLMAECVLSNLRAGDPSGQAAAPAERLRSLLSGLAGGLLVAIFVVAPTSGLQIGGSAAAIAGSAVACVYLLRQGRATPSGEPAAQARPSGESTRSGAEITPDDGTASDGTISNRLKTCPAGLWPIGVCFVLGLFFAAGQRIAHQLMPAAACTLLVQWAALLLAAAWGLKWTGRLSSRATRRQIETSACLQGAVAFAIVPLGFPLLVDFVLLLNSHVASVWALLAARSLVAGLLIAPAGILMGVLAARVVGVGAECRPALDASGRSEIPSYGFDAANGTARPVAVPFASFAVGLVAARLLMTQGAAAGVLVIAASGLLALLGTAWAARDLFATCAWRMRTAVAAACVLPVVAVTFHSSSDPVRAARLLFSTNVFLAKQAGLNPQLLTVIDDARLVAAREGQHGTQTLWKLRGVEYQLRDSGIPRGVASGDPRMCPQYAPEVMQSVLPLVLHDRPSRVLVLGLGSGVPLATCLRFPVLEVACAEQDAGLVQLLNTHVWTRSRSPLADSRVQPIALEPVLTVAARHEPYDVIISNPDQSALLSAASCFTAEFYTHAARQLTPDGIFCQRFQAIDYGAGPLAAAARTLAAAFRTVLFLETGRGEYALLATNSAHGLVRDGLVQRLQAPQVARVLGELGWDWSMILNLNAFDHAQLARFAAETEASVNTAVSGQLAYRLPQEILRWGAKTQEVHARLGRHATRLLAWDNVEGDDPDLLRRLAEVTGQRKMMTGTPDQYWIYRKTVREQITERPRALIVPVKGDVVQEIHPIDQRRLDYFAALGEALRSHPLRPDDIRHVAEFAFPFDPLISYFLHQEVAELYGRLPERDFEAELPHRLHAIYFADGQDRSVRNVAAALVLLARESAALPDPLARWDQLNGLLQMLQLRWQNRGAVPPKSSRIVLNDIEKSIAGVEAAFGAMDELDRLHDIPHVDWEARRKYLERTLLRPLRTYRSQVLPHHLKRLRLLEETGEDADASPPASAGSQGSL